MKITSLFLVILTIFSVSVFFWLQKENHCIVASSRGDWIFEVARTREEHMRGLMNRTNMCDRCGMLFKWWEKSIYVMMKGIFFGSANWFSRCMKCSLGVQRRENRIKYLRNSFGVTYCPMMNWIPEIFRRWIRWVVWKGRRFIWSYWADKLIT